MRVLFFSASVGSGHDQAAKSLMHEIQSRSTFATVEMLDVMNAVSPFLNKIIVESYLGLLRQAPVIYGKLYEQLTNDGFLETSVLKNKLIARKLLESVTRFRPSIIVSTHPFANILMGDLQERGYLPCPVTTILTDYSVHSLWLHSGISRFYVAAEDLTCLLELHGIPRDKIKVTGIPVRKQFSTILNRDIHDVRAELGLAEKNTLLFMGGGLGLGDIADVLKSVDSTLDNVQILVVCGNNSELRKTIESINVRNEIRCYGFVEEIAKLQFASDIVITKPGGLTSTEALCLRKPLAIISPIPGQEAYNQHFFLNHGVAVSVPTNGYAGHTIGNLLHNETRLQCMQRLGAQIGNPYAAKDIVDDLIDLAR